MRGETVIGRMGNGEKKDRTAKGSIDTMAKTYMAQHRHITSHMIAVTSQMILKEHHAYHGNEILLHVI